MPDSRADAGRPTGFWSWPVQLVLRFTVIYGVLLYASVQLPVYSTIERLGVGVVHALLQVGGGETSRALGYDFEVTPPSYVYEVTGADGNTRTVRKAFHAHAFVLVLFFALVVATPQLGLKRGAIALGAGGLLFFAIGVGMLMTDVQGWDREIVPGGGPFPGFIDWMAGMHRTAGPGVLPVILWAFFASGPLQAALRPTSGRVRKKSPKKRN